MRPAQSVSTEELLRRTRRGDPEAARQLLARMIDQHYAGVFNWCRHLGVSREEADDLTQETFLQAHSSLQQFAGDSSLRTWLYGIARNLCRRALEGDGREQPLPRALDLPESGGAGLHQTLEGRLAREALQALPEPVAPVALLYYLHEWKLREIALLLEIPEGTVKSRLHRARGLLRERLGEADPAVVEEADEHVR
jgi:RNA polymerase sigma-70 factor (ECF subfamily)